MLKRFLTVLAIVAIGFAAGCSRQANAPGATPTSEYSGLKKIIVPIEPTPKPRSAWEAVMRNSGPDGVPSKQVALSAFSLAFGPLPGVAMPPGPRGLISSGTGALRWVWGHWNELTPAQRKVVLSYLRRPRVHAMRFASVAIRDRGRNDEVIAALTQSQYEAMVHAARVDIAGLLHRDLGYDPAVVINSMEMFPTQPYSGPLVFDALAYAFSYDASGRPMPCIVWINPSLQASTFRIQQEVIPHEVFHCFQMALFSSAAVLGTKPSWLIEGQAEWVGCTIAGHCDVGVGSWDTYFNSGRTPLFSRKYDAIGYYSELNYVGISPWDHFDEMLQASGSADAYQRAITGNANAFEDAWAPSYGRSKYRDPSLSAKVWDSSGPGITAAMSNLLSFVLSDNTELQPAPIGPYQNVLLRPDFEADIIVVQTNSAHARIHFADGSELAGVALEGTAFCTRSDECVTPKCPSAHYEKAVKGEGYFAISGADTGASVGILGLSVDQHCRGTPPPPPPPPGPGTQTSGLPGACALLTQAEANSILHMPNTVDTTRVNPTLSSSCTYSTARVDPTFAQINVSVWNNMPGPYPAGGTPCGHAATCYPIQKMAGVLHARGGVITIVAGGEKRDTHAMVQQIQAYILQKI